jgi:gas vesicle protein
MIGCYLPNDFTPQSRREVSNLLPADSANSARIAFPSVNDSRRRRTAHRLGAGHRAQIRLGFLLDNQDGSSGFSLIGIAVAYETPGEHMNKDHTLGFVVGFSVGLGIALLLAPKSGANTRSTIAKTAREGSDYLKQQVSDLSDTAADLLGKARKESVREESHEDAARAKTEYPKESAF